MGDIDNPSDYRRDSTSGKSLNKPDRVVGACLKITSRFSSIFLTSVFPESETISDSEGLFAVDDESCQLLNKLSGLGIKREKIIELFNAQFSRQVRNTLQFRIPASDAEPVETTGSLSLVNETQLEESLAIDNLTEKMHQNFREELYCLQQRFSHLYPHHKISNAKLPFGPDNFCAAFQGMVQELDVELKLKLYLFKLLDKALMKDADKYYHDLNALLIAEGVLPTLKRKLINKTENTRHAGATEINPSSSGTSGVQESPGNQDIVQNDARMYQALQQLLAFNEMQGMHGGMASQPSTTAGVRDMFTVTPMLLDSLSQIQQSFSDASGIDGQARGSLKDQVSKMLIVKDGSGITQGINQIDNETIDVISMIFDLILDDKALPDFIKVLIGRLQIPILKAAIIDRGFFRSKSHPARQLINKLAYAGVGWSEDSDAAKDRLYEKMESIVLAVLNEFENDLQIFEELLSEFNVFIEKEKKEFELAQKKIQREALKKESLEKQKREIASLIIDKTKHEKIPDEILEFLLKTWSRVIAEMTASSEVSEPDCKKAVRLVDDLVWSLSPKNNSEQRNQLILLLPNMLKMMRVGLERINYDSEKSKAIFEMLEQYHFSALKNPSAGNENPLEASEAVKTTASGPDTAVDKAIDCEIEKLNNEIDSLPDLDGDSYHLFAEMDNDKPSGEPDKFEKIMAEMGLEHEVDPGPVIEDEFTELVRGLELGAWVELTNNDGKKVRAKLAWRGDQFTNFSFMNRQYRVIAERPLFVLADEFRQGKAALVDAPDLFDQALDGVISRIVKVAG